MAARTLLGNAWRRRSALRVRLVPRALAGLANVHDGGAPRVVGVRLPKVMARGTPPHDLHVVARVRRRLGRRIWGTTCPLARVARPGGHVSSDAISASGACRAVHFGSFVGALSLRVQHEPTGCPVQAAARASRSCSSRRFGQSDQSEPSSSPSSHVASRARRRSGWASGRRRPPRQA